MVDAGADRTSSSRSPLLIRIPERLDGSGPRVAGPSDGTADLEGRPGVIAGCGSSKPAAPQVSYVPLPHGSCPNASVQPGSAGTPDDLGECRLTGYSTA